ncbi:alpha/beta hydrolase [Thermodesulfovibrio yellowstonii]|uniref:Uncharacterized protein n=1 Tax=Thermodesulfovibrio yellowstonii (strain ATCC 51303 / DSM 11347 / YP87) TaxID=289376 RepID=B5YK40_THEYD|nr:alpha/beta hydrolase [Thermodesulfovibrio yellowstonii]ACI20580.1 hypothetical protein THEYE_A0763 [Thermodesulfovibrio yellowstonii DSM 11347]MDI6865354.1 alpha/beta hydrolase [Thermodesulfovibrio yellowstonii]
MKLFISGWAGFREALEDIPEDWDFICPFIDFNEEGILDFLKDKSGDILVGWSTGGHIVLKNLDFFSDKFSEILIIAGFKKFTQYVSPRILKKMIQKMQIEPEIVIKDFLTNAGCAPILPKKIDNISLINGLNFLLTSDIHINKSNRQVNCELILIHGKKDKIIPPQAVYDLREFYPQAKTYLIDGEHWLTFKKIEKFFYMPR